MALDDSPGLGVDLPPVSILCEFKRGGICSRNSQSWFDWKHRIDVCVAFGVTPVTFAVVRRPSEEFNVIELDSGHD